MTNIQFTTAEGKRNVKVCNLARKQAIDKVLDMLAELAPTVAANGEIAIPVAIDEYTGETYYLRLAASLSAKPLDAKVAKKAKTPVEVVLPDLF